LGIIFVEVSNLKKGNKIRVNPIYTKLAKKRLPWAGRGSNTFNLYASDVSGDFEWERRYSTGLGYRRNYRAAPLR